MNKVVDLMLMFMILTATILWVNMPATINVVTVAETKTDIVTFILNETKNVTIMYYIDGGLGYRYATIDYSATAIIPNNTIIYLYSYYPFEANGKVAKYIATSYEYTISIKIENSTTIYINFLPKAPAYHFNASTLPQPVTTINAETLQSNNLKDFDNILAYIMFSLIIIFLIVILIAKKSKS